MTFTPSDTTHYNPATATVTINVNAPPPPHVTGIVSVTRTKKGLTAITVGFDETIAPGSVVNPAQYSVLGAVTKRKKILYTKAVAIKGISFDGDAHVTINLSKPFKGAVQVTVQGGIKAANGASSTKAFSAVVH